MNGTRFISRWTTNSQKGLQGPVYFLQGLQNPSLMATALADYCPQGNECSGATSQYINFRGNQPNMWYCPKGSGIPGIWDHVVHSKWAPSRDAVMLHGA